jgi:hypothetical protein
VPFLFSDQFLDALEEGRLVLFYPSVEDGLVMVEDKVIEILAEAGRRAESRERFAGSFFPSPEPDRIKVGVADEVNFSSRHIHSSLSKGNPF